MKLIKFIAFAAILIFAISGKGCQVNILSNVMDIAPGAEVANATQEQQFDVSLTTTMPEQQPAQGQGSGFGASLFGLVALIVVGICYYVWQRGNPSDYIGDEKWK